MNPDPTCRYPALRASALATAGRPAKHSLLRGAGVASVCSSRDGAACAVGLASALRAQRLCAVLNSLSGDLTSSSLALLAEAGRFEELGKRGVWSGARVASSAAGVRLDVLALDVATAHSPSWMGGVLRLLASRAAARVVSGLPLHGFDLDRSLEAAFRLLQSGGSTGKVVVRVASPPVL